MYLRQRGVRCAWKHILQTCTGEQLKLGEDWHALITGQGTGEQDKVGPERTGMNVPF